MVFLALIFGLTAFVYSLVGFAGGRFQLSRSWGTGIFERDRIGHLDGGCRRQTHLIGGC